MKFAIVIYSYYPDEDGGTYNPIAVKLSDGTVKTTVREIGIVLKEIDIVEALEEFNNNHDLVCMPFTDETAMKIMRQAINPRKQKDENLQ